MQSMDLAAWVFGFGHREKDLGFLAAWLREEKQRGRIRQVSWVGIKKLIFGFNIQL